MSQCVFYSVSLEAGGQLWGVGSLLPLCEFQRQNLCHQAWRQASLPDEPSHLPEILLKDMKEKGTLWEERGDQHKEGTENNGMIVINYIIYMRELIMIQLISLIDILT